MAISFLSSQTITGTLSVSSISLASTDYDKFLTAGGSGRIEYVTGVQLRGYIGAGTVSSVGISHAGNAFTVGSAVTTSGTLAISMAGSGTQYVNGAGNLVNFPSIPQGDITAIIAGDGLEGSSLGGPIPTLTVGAGDGISVGADEIRVDSTVVRTTGAQTINGTKTFGTVPIVGTRGVNDDTTYAASTAWVKDQGYINSSTNNYATSFSWATGTGVLTLNRQGLGSITVDLDGRYLTSATNNYVTGGNVTSGTVTLNRQGLGNISFLINTSQITNGAGYTTNVGTTTASNSQTFTNKGGNISQWTNNSGYYSTCEEVVNCIRDQAINPATVTATTISATNLTVAATLNVRGAIDLADNDILRFGSSDDCEFFTNGSHMYMDLNPGIGNFYIRDGTTVRYTFDDSGAFTATGNVSAFSDRRLKDNIVTLDGSKVLEMRGVSYIKEGKKGSGVIAQELEEVAPELVHTLDDEMGTKAVAYGNLVGYLIEAVKDQQKQIDKLKMKLDDISK